MSLPCPFPSLPMTNLRVVAVAMVSPMLSVRILTILELVAKIQVSGSLS